MAPELARSASQGAGLPGPSQRLHHDGGTLPPMTAAAT